MMKAMKLLIITACIFLGTTSFAGPNTTYSREHNVTNEELIEGALKRLQEKGQLAFSIPTMDVEGKWMLKVVEYVRVHRPHYVITTVQGKWGYEYDVKVPTGGGFKIAMDPMVVEIQPNPETISEMESRMEYHRFIFEAAQKSGLKIMSRVILSEEALMEHMNKVGITNPRTINATRTYCTEELTGHLNVGARSTGFDAESFIRYLAYWFNQEKSYEIFGKNSASRKAGATPLNLQPDESQAAFQSLLNEFEAGRIKTVEEAADWMNEKVYTQNPFVSPFISSKHSQSIGVKYLSSPKFVEIDQPFEHREMKQPLSAEEDLLIRKFMDHLVEFTISEKGQPIPYFFRKFKAGEDPMGVTIGENALEFWMLAGEAKVKWRDYQAMLYPDLREFMILYEGDLQDFFNGAIDWSDRHQVLTFTHDVVKKFYRSHWMEQHVLRELSMLSGAIPDDSLDLMLTILEQELISNPQILRPFFKKLSLLPRFSNNHRIASFLHRHSDDSIDADCTDYAGG